MSDGYRLAGDNLVLDKIDGNAPVIQVGDLNDDSKGWTATIDNVLEGQDGLHKSGNGTLVLTRDALVSGTTTVAAGGLQLGDGPDGRHDQDRCGSGQCLWRQLAGL
ncbi:hypothetical protein [Brucella pituitosa]|uniref:hypothetical protein n=1 Tax=Brucella pituitosa TaxID=571256 RepID=UPI0009A1641B|nr:hypothetical protein [Brucella pituitosa]